MQPSKQVNGTGKQHDDDSQQPKDGLESDHRCRPEKRILAEFVPEVAD